MNRTSIFTALGMILFLILRSSKAFGEVYSLRQPFQGEVSVTERGDIHVRVKPLKGEGGYQFAERLTLEKNRWKALARLNKTKELHAEKFYDIPFEWLAPPYRLAVIETVFPDRKSVV